MWDYGLGAAIDRVRRALGSCEIHDPEQALVSGVGVVVDRADVAVMLGYVETGANWDNQQNIVLQGERDGLLERLERAELFCMAAAKHMLTPGEAFMSHNDLELLRAWQASRDAAFALIHETEGVGE